MASPPLPLLPLDTEPRDVLRINQPTKCRLSVAKLTGLQQLPNPC
jgi:hypothetical protein